MNNLYLTWYEKITDIFIGEEEIKWSEDSELLIQSVMDGWMILKVNYPNLIQKLVKHQINEKYDYFLEYNEYNEPNQKE